MAVLPLLVLAVPVLVLLLWYFQFWSSHRRILSTASKLPCPPTTPLLGNALLFTKGISFTKTLNKYATQFKSLFCIWIGPVPVFVVSVPSDVQAVLNSSGTLEKDEIYKCLCIALRNGLLTAPVRVWKRYRRLITPVLHPANVQLFLPEFNAIGRQLSNELGCGQLIDPRERLFNASVDAVMSTVMARRYVDSTTKRNIYFLMDRVGQLFTYRLFKVWLHVDWIFNFCYRSELKQAVEAVSECLKVFQQEWEDEEMMRNSSTGVKQFDRSEYKPRLSLIDVAWENRLENDPDHEWSDEVFTMIAGATDTVVAAVSYLLVTLANHPEAQDKIKAEIREVMGDSNNDVSSADLEAMPYLGCALLEAMRLHGIFPVILRRATKDTKLSSCSFTLPEGSRILIDLHSMGWDPDKFPEPNKFIPERFLDTKETTRNPSTFLPFSGGPRNCPGKTYAMLFMKTIVVHLLRKYCLTSPVQLKDIEYDLKVVLISKIPLPILFEPIKT